MTPPTAGHRDGSSPGRSSVGRTAPLDQPQPKRPFVDREQEVALIESKLLSGGVEGKQIRAGLVCFWGAFGMGKTWLLRELERVFAYPWPRESSHPAAAARLDLSQKRSPALWPQNGFEHERLIRQLWKQLADQLNESLPEEQAASLEDRALSFVNQVTSWAVEKCTSVILLDTVDDLIDNDPGAFTWLERHVVEPLAITNRVIFVFSSRGVINKWGPLQVRRRIHSHKLIGFDEKMAAKAVRAGEQVGRYLVRHTYGHPLASERLASKIEKKLGLALEECGNIELSADEALLDSVLEEVIAEVLSALDGSLHDQALAVSILRWVNIESLRRVSEKTGLEPEGLGDGHYLDQVIGEMQAHHLLNWSSNRNCWVMDPVLRCLMAHSLEIRDPGQFVKTHQAAYDYYTSQLQKYPAYLEDYVPELAFHLGWLLKYGDSDAARAKFTAWWKKFPPAANPPQPERWEKLLVVLEQDDESRENLPETIQQLLTAKSAQYATVTKGE